MESAIYRVFAAVNANIATDVQRFSRDLRANAASPGIQQTRFSCNLLRHFTRKD
jgi:hypothetical protein